MKTLIIFGSMLSFMVMLLAAGPGQASLEWKILLRLFGRGTRTNALFCVRYFRKIY